MGLRPNNTYTAFIDDNYTEAQRREIGLLIINYIQDRTRQGLGIGKLPFRNSRGQKRYSENYVESKEFEVAGKSPNQINLSFTGDMLDSLEILDASKTGEVKIGFSSDTESDKSVFLEEKGYKFLGLTNSELSEILDGYDRPAERNLDISPVLIQSLVRGLFER
jgi:hypothetical protein